MVKLRTLTFSIFLIALSNCSTTEMPLAHDNPLDAIFDNGNFRMVLTDDYNTTTQMTTLHWSNVYHTTEKELNTINFKLNTTANLLYKTGVPSTTDVQLVKTQQPLVGYTALTPSPIKANGSTYAGTTDMLPANSKGCFIVEFNYKFTSKTGVTETGILHSNFVIVQ